MKNVMNTGLTPEDVANTVKFVLKDTQDEGDKKNIEIKLNKVL